jgi:hypothetical protein
VVRHLARVQGPLEPRRDTSAGTSMVERTGLGFVAVAPALPRPTWLILTDSALKNASDPRPDPEADQNCATSEIES